MSMVEVHVRGRESEEVACGSACSLISLSFKIPATDSPYMK